MDADRFDALLRSLSTPRPRRSLTHLVAGSLLGGTIGNWWLSETVAKGKGKKKRRKKKPAVRPAVQVQCPATCPECQQCVNGQFCTPLNGAVCQNNACKVCQGGACADNNGNACGNSVCKACQGGQCVDTANNTTCNGTGKCVDGTCNPAPDCLPKGTACPGAKPCCSGDCTNNACGTSAEGENCITNRDCNTSDIAGFNACNTSFKCQAPVIGP